MSACDDICAMLPISKTVSMLGFPRTRAKTPVEAAADDETLVGVARGEVGVAAGESGVVAMGKGEKGAAGERSALKGSEEDDEEADSSCVMPSRMTGRKCLR